MAPPRRPTDLGYLLIGQPSLSALIARSLATKGDQPSLIEPRYQLVVQALDLTDVEYRYNMRRPTWEVGLAQAAVAAQYPIFTASFQFNSPRVFAIIEEITISNNGAAATGALFGIGYVGGAGIAANVVGWQCDDRFGAPAARGALTWGAGANAAQPVNANYSTVQIPPGANITLRGPWILSGNQGAVFQSAFNVVGTAVNVPLILRARWYEREPLASEL
jgi:hypothetical protein